MKWKIFKKIRLTFVEQMRLKYALKIMYDLIIITLAFLYSIHIFSNGSFNLDFVFRRVIDIIFILDFLWNLIRAKNKNKFLKHNFWMILALLPISQLKALQALRLLHIFRLAQIVLILEKFKLNWLETSPFYLKLKTSSYYKNALNFIVYNLILIPIIMQIVEPTTYKNYGDGLWWCIVTLTTVGYGDIFPKTAIGKIASSYTLLIGIFTYASFIATITDYINYLLNTKRKKQQIAAFEKIFELENKIEKLEHQNEVIIKLLKAKDKKR